MFGIKQLVDFPTRGKNALDLVFSDLEGAATQHVHLGTSDHHALSVVFKIDSKPTAPPSRVPVYHWGDAPWSHIKGSLKRDLQDWNVKSLGSVDQTEGAFADIILKTTDRYVKQSIPQKRKILPWWNLACSRAFKKKQKAFVQRQSHPVKYSQAKKLCKQLQGRAFANYQK